MILYKNYNQERKEMKEEIMIEEKIVLRNKQGGMAMAGDTKMLIQLGKQYLGQQDSPNENDFELGFGRGVQLVMPQDTD